jgi:hypothetical protein
MSSISIFADESDSLLTSKISEMDNQLTLISNRLNEYDISKNFIHNDIVIFAAIVSILCGILFLFFTFLAAYLIPKNTEKIIDKKIEKQEEQFNNFIKKLDELHERITLTEGRVLRSLFENQLNAPYWQFIWGIRYCDYLFREDHEESLKKIIKKSYEIFQANLNASKFNDEKKYHLKKILVKILQSENEEVTKIASDIIGELTH